MKKLTSISSLLLLILTVNLGYSQSFKFGGFTPFGIQIINMEDTSRFAYKYMFQDMDADGDLDLFLFGLDGIDTVSSNSDLQNLRYFIEIQENIGNKWNPEFKAREKKFENFNFAIGNSFFIPSIGDLNGDGKQDMVISADADSYFIQNIRFDIQSEDFLFDTHLGSEYELSSFSPGSIFIPELIDLDLDGDLDLLLSGGSKSLLEEDEDINIQLYAKNIGTATSPDFLGWFANPYGLHAGESSSFICGDDLDLDGDVDLLGVIQRDSLQSLEYFENKQGSDGRPLFAGSVVADFGLPQPSLNAESFYFPSLVDLDGDGDIDIFLPYTYIDTIEGEGDKITYDTLFNLFYYENILCEVDEEFWNESICPGDSFFVDGIWYNESGNWDIETTNTNGCKSVRHISLEVSPEINFEITNDGPVLMAINDDTYTYQWFDCDKEEEISAATENTFEPAYSGNFAVIITDQYGCEEMSACFYLDITDISLFQLNQEISIYPNPTNGLISVSNKSNKKIRTIEIFGVSGTYLKEINPGNFQSIDLSLYPSGIYFFRIITDDDRQIIRKVLLFDNFED